MNDEPITFADVLFACVFGVALGVLIALGI
jgi:hypothetical protein